MATLSERLPQNAPGRFYVDSSCIDCDLCRDAAPDFFHRDGEIGMSAVFRQPKTPQAILEAQKALEGCPTESIGNDGAPATEPTSSVPE
ncbi:MAG: ferredoxin [Limisphaerales bacterium]